MRKETDFVKAGDGTYDFGMIDKDVAEAIGGKEAPVRLQTGNDSYGETHINRADNGHRLKTIQNAGYHSVRDFIEDVSKNWSEIKEGTGTSKLLIKKNGKNSVAAIELKSDDNGSYYTVITGGIFKREYAIKKEPLLQRGAPPSLDRPGQSIALAANASSESQEGIDERTGQSGHTTTIPKQHGDVKG